MKLTPRTYIPGLAEGRDAPAGSRRAGVFRFIVLFLFSFSLALLYQGMRGILHLGGFVASGGPYAIAHPAPGWVWILPVSMILVIMTMLAGFTGSLKSGAPYLMALSWPALFLSLGWNFLDFGLGLPTDGRLAAGWLICAVLFLLMGGLPLWIVLKSFFSSRIHPAGEPSPSPWGPLLTQALLAAAGIYLGIVAFRAVLR